MKKIQNFSYHMHTNFAGVYDGRNSAIEMIKKAEEVGYSELGISNHFCYHPNMKLDHKMFFNDFNIALDYAKINIEDIRTAGQKSKIKVYVGFEVDFFESKQWRNDFEKMKKELDVDYLIGATHFLKDKNEDNVFNIYFMDKYKANMTSEELDLYLVGYWQNLISSIESGYFDFIAHLDVPKNLGYCVDKKWDKYKQKTIETLTKYKQPYEFNTSGITKTGEQNPHTWMIEALNKNNVPIVVSDDAHEVGQVSAHFEYAEDFLTKINYQNRWKLNK